MRRPPLMAFAQAMQRPSLVKITMEQGRFGLKGSVAHATWRNRTAQSHQGRCAGLGSNFRTVVKGCLHGGCDRHAPRPHPRAMNTPIRRGNPVACGAGAHHAMHSERGRLRSIRGIGCIHRRQGPQPITGAHRERIGVGHPHRPLCGARLHCIKQRDQQDQPHRPWPVQRRARTGSWRGTQICHADA